MKQTFTRLFGLSGKEEHEVEQVVEQVVNNNHVQQIPLQYIIPNRYQPRTVFVDERIAELASTIHTHGIIQPIIIRKYEGDKYEIIAGERRFRAVTSLGWETIPAIVKEMNDTEVASVALIENLQREELTAIEEAMAYEKLIQLHELTQEALAQRLGKGQSTVANKLRLLKLPQAVQDALLHKKITERHARALIPLKDPEQQVKVLEQVIERKLNVKQTEDCVVKLLEQKTQRPKKRRKSVSKDTRIALNTIRESLAMVSSTGLPIDSNEEEHEDYYQITIKIPKK